MPDCGTCTDCATCPECPGCTTCGPPGGLFVPATGTKKGTADSPFIGQPGTLYTWLAGPFAATVTEVTGAMEATLLYWSKDARSSFPSTKIAVAGSLKDLADYQDAVKDWQAILGKQMDLFMASWKPKPFPVNSWTRDENGQAMFLPGRKLEFDCPALVIAQDGATATLRYFLNSSGWIDGVQYIEGDAVLSFYAARMAYVNARQPFLDAALADWKKSYPHSKYNPV